MNTNSFKRKECSPITFAYKTFTMNIQRNHQKKKNKRNISIKILMHVYLPTYTYTSRTDIYSLYFCEPIYMMSMFSYILPLSLISLVI